MRVAAIDCGTNSIRLLIADIEGNSFREVTRLMEVVRLGQGVDKTGQFHPDAITRTLAAVDLYAAEIAKRGVEKIRFCATSATRDADAPCYHCLFPEAEDVEALNCATTGVFAPLVGIIGSMQAAEALKVIAQIGTSLKGRLLILDALDMQWHSVKVKRDPACIVCATRKPT